MTGNELAALRRRLGLSCKAFAVHIGMGAGADRTIRRWEAGEARIPPERLARIHALTEDATAVHTIICAGKVVRVTMPILAKDRGHARRLAQKLRRAVETHTIFKTVMLHGKGEEQ